MSDHLAVRLRDATVGYGNRVALRDLSLEVAQGELVGVVGPSGSGKTTLLRALTGQADVHHGAVEIAYRQVVAGRAPASVGYVPQVEHIDWDFPLTVEQVVLLGNSSASAALPWFSRHERRHARELLDRLGIGTLRDRHIRELSGGQQQRMFLARALLRRCELLLLDEPTSGVDLATRRDILGLLAELNADGLTVLLTTHDLNFVAAHLPRVVCLNGRIAADGDPTQVLTSDVLARTYGAPMRVLRDGDRVVIVDEAPLVTRAPRGIDPLLDDLPVPEVPR